MLAVSQSLFGVGLYQARSECQCFLSILDFDGLLGFLSNFVQSGLDDFKVQIDQLFEAAEERTLDGKQVVQRSFLAGQNLLRDCAHDISFISEPLTRFVMSGDHPGVKIKKAKQITYTCENLPCCIAQIQFYLKKSTSQDFFVATQQNTSKPLKYDNPYQQHGHL